MKQMKTTILTIIFMFSCSSLFSADALIWGYFTDMNDNDLAGTVNGTSSFYQNSTSANGLYLLYLPAGTYAFTATSDGYKTETFEYVIENNETYNFDFTLEVE